jgi:hypothetical protein
VTAGEKGTPGSDRALTAAFDELYAAPFDGFVALRRELSGRLRAAGDPAAARQMAGATKPTRTAWALNQVARSHPEVVAEVVRSREAAASSQKMGESKAARDGARQYRDAVSKAVQAVRTLLGTDGVVLSSAQARRVGETLQALASDEAGRATLRAGRLTRDVEVDDPFAGIEVGHLANLPKERAPGRGEGTSKRGDEHANAGEAERVREERERLAMQRAIGEAQARVVEIDTAVSAAHETVAAAEREVRRAQYDLDKATRALTDLERRLELARAALKKLNSAPLSPQGRTLRIGTYGTDH